jgi:hypothetical protein
LLHTIEEKTLCSKERFDLSSNSRSNYGGHFYGSREGGGLIWRRASEGVSVLIIIERFFYIEGDAGSI